MNTGIRMKTSPTPIKFENVSPIFKSDDNMYKGNFRPVSILPVSSKLHEGILIDEILDHFREIFDVLPSVYRRHYSCQIVILKFVEDVKSAWEGVIWWVTFLLTYPRLSIVSYTVFSLPNCMLIVYQCSPVNWYLITLVIASDVSRLQTIVGLYLRTLSEIVPQGWTSTTMQMIFLCQARRQMWMSFYPVLKITSRWNGLTTMGLKLTHINSNSWLWHQNILNHKSSLLVAMSVFNEHIRVCTLKAARQLNAFSSIQVFGNQIQKCSVPQFGCQ